MATYAPLHGLASRRTQPLHSERALGTGVGGRRPSQLTEQHGCRLGDVVDLPFGLIVIERRGTVPVTTGLPAGPRGALGTEKLTRHLGQHQGRGRS